MADFLAGTEAGNDIGAPSHWEPVFWPAPPRRVDPPLVLVATSAPAAPPAPAPENDGRWPLDRLLQQQFDRGYAAGRAARKTSDRIVWAGIGFALGLAVIVGGCTLFAAADRPVPRAMKLGGMA